MYVREKVVLYLISQLEKRNVPISKTYLHKISFILSKESIMARYVKFYNFYPYLYGPYSNQLSLDMANLQSLALLDEKLDTTEQYKSEPYSINRNVEDIVNSVIDGLIGKDIVEYVYDKYPEYTTKSKLKAHQDNENKAGMFSIGYEKHNIDSFLDLLIQNEVEVVADLRFNPFSMNLAFTKSRLEHNLKKAGITYRHIPELGIDGKYRKSLDTDEDYERLFEFYSSEILPKQEDKVKCIADMSKEKRVAMLCFEHDKDHCHRGVISNELEKDAITVKHL